MTIKNRWPDRYDRDEVPLPPTRKPSPAPISAVPISKKAKAKKTPAKRLTARKNQATPIVRPFKKAERSNAPWLNDFIWREGGPLPSDFIWRRGDPDDWP